ncbi:MAG: indolepyruvate oxidoreductase subunit beta [delta proteobacterium ML8_F1]|nr:MAG: indolepyruvate oxidoreductase subunit beta [delta proteobacterium ML8_F1]
MTETRNILLSGVGGQGIILASKILSTGLINAGYDVKMSEVHGMAQRGGSVTTQVRYGDKVDSPIIGKGQADILVSFEVMETGRWLEYLKLSGQVIINQWEIGSAPILSGKSLYPKGVIEEIASKVEETTVIDAARLAREIGNIRTMNVVIVGALIKALGLEALDWEEVIRSTVKPKFVDVNIIALKAGMDQIQ